MLIELDHIPDGLLEVASDKLLDLLGGPTLIHLQGDIDAPLFLVVLQHGNETTGFIALQEILKKYQNKSLPRSMSIFIGNVYAAQKGLRRLDDQVDYNRVWPGHEYGDCPETKMMQQVFNSIEARKPFASIDIHNNTGSNPHYACVNKVDSSFLALANQFSHTIVYFTRPLGVQSNAFSQICPSVTVECGKVGQSFSVPHAVTFIDSCLKIKVLHKDASDPVHDNIYSTVGIVRVSKDFSFSFTDKTTDILLDANLDNLNFRELVPGTLLGSYKDNAFRGIEVWNNEGSNVADEYFVFDKNEIRISKPVMPSMLTLDEVIIRQDCLCYLMERFDSKSLVNK